jgi:LacI family transcriptional regulator
VAVGELAAEHFLERGYQHFGFFGSGSVYYAQVREASFRHSVGQAGFDVSACHLEYMPRLPTQVSWKSVSQQVRHWLKGLSKPVAVLADHDAAAHELADMCQQLHLRVPDEVAVLGVDNDDLECQLTFPPLSSIAIPAERIGFEAAKLLERMLSGKSVTCEPIYLPPLRVVTRQSTSTLAIADPVVAAALCYIRQRVGQPIRVSSIASDLAVPRRGLEKKFRALLGRSVLAEIHRARVDQAKELLADTDLKMLQVARRLGFSNSQRLALVFRKITGMTPGAYRRQSRLGER